VIAKVFFKLSVDKVAKIKMQFREELLLLVCQSYAKMSS